MLGAKQNSLPKRLGKPNPMPVPGSDLRAGRWQRADTVLEIRLEIFSGHVVRALVNECIVPALVDKFLAKQCPLEATPEPIHNEEQP